MVAGSLTAVLLCSFSVLCLAAEESSKPAQNTSLEISARQEGIARRYQEFETVIQRMADLLKRTEPDRSALLQKIFKESKRSLILVELGELVHKLKNEKFGSDLGKEVIQTQESLIEEMTALLDLMLSEDRADRLRERRQRIEKYLQEIRKLRRSQQELRSRTERAGRSGSGENSGSDLADQQKKLADRTGELGKKIQQEDAEAGGEGKATGGAKSQKPKAKSQKNQGSGGKEQDSPSGEQFDSPMDDERTPGRQNVEKASRAMQEAQRKLEELERQRASKSQDKAIRELDRAIAELQEILRQLREEERQELLRSLESRFRKMLEMQRIVYEGTKSLDRVSRKKRTRADEQRALGLSRRERELVLEIDRALLLLREDGTAIAFPEAVRQLREDVVLIVSLLAKIQTGEFTQSVEQDVIAALEEMIESLRRELQESEDRNFKPQDGRPGPLPLVDQLAELKMIRSLQKRVNDRTERIARLAEVPDSLGEELDQAVRDLAERQIRIYGITRDIALGKNK